MYRRHQSIPRQQRQAGQLKNRLCKNEILIPSVLVIGSTRSSARFSLWETANQLRQVKLKRFPHCPHTNETKEAMTLCCVALVQTHCYLLEGRMDSERGGKGVTCLLACVPAARLSCTGAAEVCQSGCFCDVEPFCVCLGLSGSPMLKDRHNQ